MAKTLTYANDLLKKALVAQPDVIMTICGDMATNTDLTLKEIKTITKQVLEVVRIRNNLALLLFRTDVGDPRQFELFAEGLSPEDFE